MTVSAGVNYKLVNQIPFWKRLLRLALTVPVINRLMVMIANRMPNAGWKARLPVVGEGKLTLDGGGDVVLLHAERCSVAREVYWGRGRLHSQSDRLALNLAVVLSRDADVFLDIGSYTGLFALAVARSNTSIQCHAYEIVPENFQLLWGNTIRNDLVQRVHPWLLGLGAQAGQLTVPASLGDGVLASSVALDAVTSDGVAVPVASLDDLFKDYRGRFVLKIDVEGFEWEVFRGGQRFLRDLRPDMVCEVLRRAPNIPELEVFLKSAGYSIYHISDDGLCVAKHIVPVRHERDWLFSVRSIEELKALGFPFVAS